jgi:hypothetical protein
LEIKGSPEDTDMLKPISTIMRGPLKRHDAICQTKETIATPKARIATPKARIATASVMRSSVVGSCILAIVGTR